MNINMKSKEIYLLGVGVLALILIFVWRSSSNNSMLSTAQDGEQTETGAKPASNTSNTKKPAASTKLPTSVNPTVAPEKPIPTAVTSQSLSGSTYRLVTYNGEALPKDSKYTLSFTDNNFTLKLCNTHSSTYYIDGTLLKAGNVISTKMYCGLPANLMEMETNASLMFNSNATAIYKSGSTLILSHPQGIIFSFEGF